MPPVAKKRFLFAGNQVVPPGRWFLGRSPSESAERTSNEMLLHEVEVYSVGLEEAEKSTTAVVNQQGWPQERNSYPELLRKQTATSKFGKTRNNLRRNYVE